MTEQEQRILDVLANPERMTEALREASRRAIAIHRAFDLPLVGGQDGKVVYGSADEAEKNLSL